MKYNVGDKVLYEGDLELLFNPYHKAKYRNGLIHVVTEADEDYFTIFKPSSGYETAIKEGLSCSANAYTLFRQETGETLDSARKERLLHLLHDTEDIMQRIREIGEQGFKEKDDFFTEQINRAKTQKEHAKETYESDMKINLRLVGVTVDDLSKGEPQ